MSLGLSHLFSWSNVGVARFRRNVFENMGVGCNGKNVELQTSKLQTNIVLVLLKENNI